MHIMIYQQFFVICTWYLLSTELSPVISDIPINNRCAYVMCAKHSFCCHRAAIRPESLRLVQVGRAARSRAEENFKRESQLIEISYLNNIKKMQNYV